jgi:hypothetical protein
MPWGRHPLRGGQRDLVLGAGNRALLLREALQQIGGPLGAAQPAEVLAMAIARCRNAGSSRSRCTAAAICPAGIGARLDLTGKFVMGWLS